MSVVLIDSPKKQIDLAKKIRILRKKIPNIVREIEDNLGKKFNLETLYNNIVSIEETYSFESKEFDAACFAFRHAERLYLQERMKKLEELYDSTF